MATFKALNIESDDEEDIEIDDTKEIQIEEALKLYQQALKLHSEGPASYDQAAAAYRALFDSEIFKYPESQSELKRQDLSGVSPEQDDWQFQDEGIYLNDYTGTSENAPSTLPQIIHLSCKNYGEFLLESLQYKLQQDKVNDVSANTRDISESSLAALVAFVDAIDKDDSDLDLWRRTSAVGGLLGSNRIARFCLEAVLDGDYSGIETVLAIPGLAESLAGQQLRELVNKMQDELSLLQGPLMQKKRRQLSKLLKQRLKTYGTAQSYHQKHKVSTKSMPQPASRSLLPSPATWNDMGDLLYRHLINEQHGTTRRIPGMAVSFDIDRPSIETSVMDIDKPSPQTQSQESLPEISSLVDDQFPGMDNGQPTVVAPVPLESAKEATPDEAAEDSPGAGTALPTRKRSGDAAGFQDAEDSGRVKSKRIRARESLVDQSQLEDVSTVDLTQAEYALADLDYYDGQMVQTINRLLGKLGISEMTIPSDYRKTLRALPASAVASSDGIEQASQDLYAFFDQFSDGLAPLILLKNDSLDIPASEKITPSGRFASATGVQHQSPPKPELDQKFGLPQFMQTVNDSWLHVHDVVLRWISTLLTPGCPVFHPLLPSDKSSYTGHRWPDQLKTSFVRIIVVLDDYLYDTMSHRLETFDIELLGNKSPRSSKEICDEAFLYIEMIVTLFELHLDVYSLIKEPNSGVDAENVTTQGDRTDRWANLARDALNLRSNLTDSPNLNDELNLRYLWSATHHISVSDDISQDHIIACWQELRSIFIEIGEPVIELQNNAVMPQLCIESIDRELSRLTTHEFFDKVFDPAQTDLTVVIESLEPLLETLHRTGTPIETDKEPSSCLTNSTRQSSDSADGAIAADYSATTPPELLNYLNNSNVAERVRLWQRLREAYEGIEYQPMVVCCYFRIIELLVRELRLSSNGEKTLVERQTTLLKVIRLLHELVNKIVKLGSQNTDAFDCMEMERLQSAMSSLLDVLRLLHSFTMFHDDIHQGLRQAPTARNGFILPSFPAATDTLQELQLQSWTLLYKMFKEGIEQEKATFESPEDSRFEFLRGVHQSLGARGLCGKANRVFIRMLKLELVQLRSTEATSAEYDLEFAQALYDLYGLRCFINPTFHQQEHHCQHDAFVDKTSAMQAVDLLLTLAPQVKMSELPKHPLKDTIEKVHGLATRKKPTEAIIRNRDIYRAFLKSPINPLDLYRSLRGEGQLDLSPVPIEHAILAAKGWYFLMGQIALSKFRSQKRTGPTATEDLDIAVAFFMQDLEYSMDNWETWFRVAQAYDSKIEELVSWSAEKFNSNITEVTQYQRAAIHCYTMAVALAMRSAEPGIETSKKLAELYADFAMRLYASTRDPFNMQVFSLEDVDKFFSLEDIIKGRPFRAMTPYTAWKVARELFRRAIRLTPDRWSLHYNLGKCLWKMHERGKDSPAISGKPPTVDEVISELQKAIKLLPGKKDSRREPILEPHYKLASVVHKMVVRRRRPSEAGTKMQLSQDFVRIDLEPAEACSILAATPHAAKVEPVTDRGEWEGYILKVLKNLRTADKQHWHHRMIARVANIVYHDGSDDTLTNAAKNELTQQMFTKTMVLQVWRPEHERPGRHFVYTTRYTRFFVHLLDQLNDRAGLEALSRRVRRKPAEYFEHSSVWNDICQAYLRVLRAHGSVPLGHETAIFSGISHEDFLRRKDILEEWCQDTSNKHPTLETLQDAIELKKVNTGLMKAGVIDDLIGDAYAYLYDTIGRTLWSRQEAEEAETKREEANKAAERLAALAPSPAPERNPMMNLSHLMNVDGASETPSFSAATQPALVTPTIPTPGPAQTPGGGTMTPAEAVPASRRKIGVGRREIRVCAEACAARAATAANALPGSGPRRGSAEKEQDGSRSRTKSEVQVIIEARRPPKTSTPKAGSVDDDADDESELSEVDEDVVAMGLDIRPMFDAREEDLVNYEAVSEVEADDEADEGGDDDEEELEEEEHEEGDGEDHDITMAEGNTNGVVELEESDEEEPTYHTPLSAPG